MDKHSGAVNFIITNINFIPVTITEIEVFLDDRLIAQYYEHYRHDLGDRLPRLADRLAAGEILEFMNLLTKNSPFPLYRIIPASKEENEIYSGLILVIVSILFKAF